MGRGRVESAQTLKTKHTVLSIQILLVDDDSTSLYIVSAMLKRCSNTDRMLELSVVTVKSPLDALATLRLQHKEFDLVLTDLHMPQMNGLELQKQVDQEFKLPVIIMSSDDSESVISKSLEDGALYYIVKPVNPSDLKNVWQYAVATKKGKSIVSKEIGCTQEASSSSSVEKISGEEVNSASSVNEERCDKTDGKMKGKKRPREDHEEESNAVAPKKAKIVWTNSLHNRFLQAINHIGLEKAVPKRILEFMNVPGLSRENVASHLQKYRIFLKRVAEKSTTGSSKSLPERTMRSTFASGHPFLTFNNGEQDNSQFSGQQGRASFPPGFGRKIMVCGGSSFSPIPFSNQQVSGDNSMSQLSHGMSQSYGNMSKFQPPTLGNMNSPHQTNCASFSLRYGGMSCGQLNGLHQSNTSPDMYAQQNQGRTNFGNPSSYKFSPAATESRGSNYIPSIGNEGVVNSEYRLANANRIYGGIQMNVEGALAGTGQMGFYRTELSCGPNGGYGMTNLIQNNGMNGAPIRENGEFTSLAQGGSFAGFNGGNHFPPSFSTVNQGNISMPPPLAPQQNINRNGVDSNYSPPSQVLNNLPTWGGVSDQQQIGQTDLDDILLGPANHVTTPYQKQIGGLQLNAKFPNSSHHEEVNTPLGELLNNTEFMSSFCGEDNTLWNEQGPSQLQYGERAANTDFGGNPDMTKDYYPNFAQKQGQEELMNSNLYGTYVTDNAPENQNWDDEFLDSLFGNDSLARE